MKSLNILLKHTNFQGLKSFCKWRASSFYFNIHWVSYKIIQCGWLGIVGSFFVFTGDGVGWVVGEFDFSMNILEVGKRVRESNGVAEGALLGISLGLWLDFVLGSVLGTSLGLWLGIMMGSFDGDFVVSLVKSMKCKIVDSTNNKCAYDGEFEGICDGVLVGE